MAGARSVLDGKAVVVTGANSGIGFAAAHSFAAAGARTVLACRDAARGAAAADRILAAAPSATVEVVPLDLADLASVRAFADAVVGRLGRVDVLCNNAGVMAPPRRTTTVDGFELQFGVNHLGHFALTGLLFDTIAASAPARVVTVSSGGHRGNTLDFDDLQGTRSYGRWRAYGRSKLANLLFAYELDRRVRARGLDVTSVACHPGAAKSQLIETGSRMGGSGPAPWLRLAYALAQSAEQGALPVVEAAVGADVRGGQFLGPSGFLQSRGAPTVVTSSRQSHDLAAAQRLWAVSEDLTGVRFLS